MFIVDFSGVIVFGYYVQNSYFLRLSMAVATEMIFWLVTEFSKHLPLLSSPVDTILLPPGS